MIDRINWIDLNLSMYTQESKYGILQYSWSDEFRKYILNLFMVENVRSGVEVKTGNVPGL